MARALALWPSSANFPARGRPTAGKRAPQPNTPAPLFHNAMYARGNNVARSINDKRPVKWMPIGRGRNLMRPAARPLQMPDTRARKITIPAIIGTIARNKKKAESGRRSPDYRPTFARLSPVNNGPDNSNGYGGGGRVPLIISRDRGDSRARKSPSSGRRLAGKKGPPRSRGTSGG
jgi:hypothetical protein